MKIKDQYQKKASKKKEMAYISVVFSLIHLSPWSTIKRVPYLSSSADLTDQKVNTDISNTAQELVAGLGVLEDPLLGLGQGLASTTLNHVGL